MRIINFKNLIIILYLILAFFLLLRNSYSYLDPDLGWHLKVGEEILKTKELPKIEHFDYTLEGKEWVDHEWLMNVTSFWLYSRLGYGAVNIFFALIIILVLILLAFFTQKYVLYKGDLAPFKGAKSLILSLIPLQLLGLMASLPHWGVRMQEIAPLGLIILFIIITHYTRCCALGQKTYVLFWLLPFFYLWACLHASFLIGLFILFFWLAIKIGEGILFKIKFFHQTLKIDFKDKLNLKNNINFSLFSFLAVLLTFFTPYGLKLYDFLKEYANTFYFKHIEEWVPVHYYPIQYLQIIYAAIAAAVLLITIIYSLRKKSSENIKLNLGDFCLTALFIFLAFKSRRHFPLLFIVSLPVIIKFIFDFFPLNHGVLARESSSPEQIIFKNNKYLFLVKAYLIMAFALTATQTGLIIKPILNPFLSFCEHYPCQAIEFFKNGNFNDQPIFNSYDWGGYLIWAWPEKKLFIDGRLPQYEFAGHTLLEEYYEFFNKDKTEDKLKKYNIKLVLLKETGGKIKLNWLEQHILLLKEENFNKNKNSLKNYLEKARDWQLIYKDNVSLVYAKK